MAGYPMQTDYLVLRLRREIPFVQDFEVPR